MAPPHLPQTHTCFKALDAIEDASIQVFGAILRLDPLVFDVSIFKQ